MHYYNPNKKPNPHEYVKTNATKNKTAVIQMNMTGNATIASNHSSNLSLAAIDPVHPEGLVRAPKDKQYENPQSTQLKHPLVIDNGHDWNGSNDDIMHWYNPNKYTASGAYIQMNSTANVTHNKTMNVTANHSGNASANHSANKSGNATLVQGNHTSNLTRNHSANGSGNATLSQGDPVTVQPNTVENGMGSADLGMDMRVGPDEIHVLKIKQNHSANVSRNHSGNMSSNHSVNATLVQGVPVTVQPNPRTDEMGSADLGMDMRVGPDDIHVMKMK